MTDHADLLRRFQPQLKYDSNEAFFADSAAEWTDNPGNVLRRRTQQGRPGKVVAAAAPQTGQPQLSLDFLSDTAYADGQPVEDEDVISSPSARYREMYAALREREGYKNRMYGHAKEDSGGRLWLQYWFYYFYNDYNLAGGVGLHEGDWEMVQLRIAPDGARPDLAVYAQHIHAEQAPWEHVEKLTDSPDTAVVYVARGSHASYFDAGYHETEAWYDIADGKRATPKLALEILDDDDLPGWVRWRGRWGDTRPRIPGIDQPSPHGPIVHNQWDDPGLLCDRAKTHARPAALPAPDVDVRRRSSRLVVTFDFSKRAGSPLQTLVITVNSRDDKLPPRTFTFAIGPALRGTIETTIDLFDRQRYDIYVSTTDKDGRPSESQLVLIPALGDKPSPLEQVGAHVGRVAGEVAKTLDGFRRRRK